MCEAVTLLAPVVVTFHVRVLPSLDNVNVHTDNGVAPANTGPGDFPGGEIRGQIARQ